MEKDGALWDQAARKGLPWFRSLRRPLSAKHLDQEFSGSRLEGDWLRLKKQIQPGDQLWPFEFSVRGYLGLRKGYVLLRRGRPVDGLVTVVS